MQDPSGARTRWSWCLFHSGARPYAVRVDAVVEIVDVDGLVRLPLSPPRVMGLFTLRRDVVPVLRMAEVQDDDPGGPDTRRVVLILRTEGDVWGIPVDRGTTVGVEETHIDPGGPDSTGDGPGAPRTIARGGTSFEFVDPESAWREVRATIEGWYGSRCGRSMVPGHDGAEGSRDA
jgi:chemotaxis signal transduction protein